MAPFKLPFPAPQDQRLMKDKLLSLKQERTRQDSEQFERDKTLGHLKTRLAVLEQENQDKDKARKSCMV